MGLTIFVKLAKSGRKLYENCKVEARIGRIFFAYIEVSKYTKRIWRGLYGYTQPFNLFILGMSLNMNALGDE